jgi:hypothetical protein
VERSRSRTLLSSAVQSTVYSHSQFYDDENGIGTDWWPGSTGTSGKVLNEQTTDVVTENFRSRCGDGEIINNPFLRKTQSDVWPPAGNYDFKVIDPDNSLRYWWFRGPIYTPHDVETMEQASTAFSEIAALRASVTNIAVTSAHANISESEIMALAAIGEGGKTITSMYSILRRALKILLAVKRLDIKALTGELSPKELSQRYMEARYAIRPLMYDAAGIMSAASKDRDKVRQTYRGHHEDSFSHEYGEQTVNLIDSMYCKENRKFTYTVSARAGVLCDVSISDLQVWGGYDIVETIWELTPWSFIVDWFANIGDLLSSWSPDAGVNQRASWCTVKENFTFTTTYDDPWATSQTWNTTAEMETQKHSRCETVSTRIVDPSLSIFPEIKLRLDGYKLADLAIILRQVFSR